MKPLELRNFQNLNRLLSFFASHQFDVAGDRFAAVVSAKGVFYGISITQVIEISINQE